MADLPGDLREYAHGQLVIHRVWNGEETLHISLWDGEPEEGGQKIVTLYDARVHSEWRLEHARRIDSMLAEYPMPGQDW